MFGGLGGAVAEVVVRIAPGAHATPRRAGRIRADRLGVVPARALRARRRHASASAARSSCRTRDGRSRAKHILAIDQGTTNTKALAGRQAARSSRARRGRSRSRSRSPAGSNRTRARSGDRRGRRSTPVSAAASLHDAVGVTNQRESVVVWEPPPASPSGPASSGSAGAPPAFCDALRDARPEALLGEDRPADRPAVFGQQRSAGCSTRFPNGHARAADGELVRGNGRQLGALEPDRRRGARLRRDQRLAHAAATTWELSLGPRTAGDVRRFRAAVLPAIRPSSGIRLHGGVRTLADGVPIASLIGDSHAALFGHAAFASGASRRHTAPVRR